MIKQSNVKTVKAVTPAAFVRESKAIAEKQSYDWKAQRNSVMGYGTFRQTFGGMNPQWESD